MKNGTNYTENMKQLEWNCTWPRYWKRKKLHAEKWQFIVLGDGEQNRKPKGNLVGTYVVPKTRKAKESTRAKYDKNQGPLVSTLSCNLCHFFTKTSLLVDAVLWEHLGCLGPKEKAQVQKWDPDCCYLFPWKITNYMGWRTLPILPTNYCEHSTTT